MDAAGCGTAFSSLPHELVVGEILARVDLLSAESFGGCCRAHRSWFRTLWRSMPADLHAFARTLQRRHALERWAFTVDPASGVPSPIGDGAIRFDAAPDGCRGWEWPDELDRYEPVLAKGMRAWQRRCLAIQKRAWAQRAEYMRIPLPRGAQHLLCIWLRWPSQLVRLPPAEVLALNVRIALRTRTGTGGAWVPLFETFFFDGLGRMMTCKEWWNFGSVVRNQDLEALACRIDPQGNGAHDPAEYLAGANFVYIRTDFGVPSSIDRKKLCRFFHVGETAGVRDLRSRARRRRDRRRLAEGNGWVRPVRGSIPGACFYIDPRSWTPSARLCVIRVNDAEVTRRALPSREDVDAFDPAAYVECYSHEMGCVTCLPRPWSVVSRPFLTHHMDMSTL